MTTLRDIALVFILLFACCSDCVCEKLRKDTNRDATSLDTEASPITATLPAASRGGSPAMKGLSDHSTVTEGIQANAPEWDSVLVECANATRCPGPNAVFVRAQIEWIVRPLVDRGEAFEVTEHPPTGVVSVSSRRLDGTGEVITLRALKPGVATIMLHYRSPGRDFTTTRQLRVAAIGEAVRGEVRMRGGTKGEDGYFLADADLVGAPLPASIEIESPQLILTWILSDGTKAVGGAGRVKSAGADGRVSALGRGASGQDDLDLERTLFRFFGAPGTVRLTASLGEAVLDESFVYAYQAPSLSPCTPGDTSDFLSATGDGSEGIWPTETSGLMAHTGQDVLFPLSRDLPDVTVEQICGPERVLPYPQTNDFAARFSTPGWYQFIIKNSDGEQLQSGVYGEPVTNPYTVRAGR